MDPRLSKIAGEIEVRLKPVIDRLRREFESRWSVSRTTQWSAFSGSHLFAMVIETPKWAFGLKIHDWGWRWLIGPWHFCVRRAGAVAAPAN